MWLESGNQGRWEFHHFFPQGDENAVVRGVFKNRTAGETAEGGKDKGMVPKKETRQAQRGALAIRNSNNRMPVAGKVQTLAKRVGGIMDNPEIFPEIEKRAVAQTGRELRDFHIVISSHQDDRDSKAGHEVGECDFQVRGDAGGAVEKVAGDDELRGLGFPGEIKEPAEIARVVALRNGQAFCPESCGFPEVDVRDDQRG